MTISGGSLKQYNLHGKNSAVLQNPNIELPYNPILPPRGVKTYVHTKTCIGTFIAALFIYAKKLETIQIAIN